jgi:cell division septation protein DedD
VSDEGFREIQLNGKQLIFMFMAVTVVLVVTFLFGVLVGRDVRQGPATAEIAAGDVAPDPGLAPAADNTPAPAPGASSSASAPEAPQTEELSYADRLLREGAPEENLKAAPPEAAAPVVQEPVAPPTPSATARQAPAPSDTERQAPAPATSAKQPAPTNTASAPVAGAQASDPSGPGFAVQVAAYPDRRDAEKLVKQLATKGYPAFVMDPVQGAPTKLFRVRVGKYPNRAVAEGVQAQLAKAEQFTTAWIAR